MHPNDLRSHVDFDSYLKKALKPLTPKASVTLVSPKIQKHETFNNPQRTLVISLARMTRSSVQSFKINSKLEESGLFGIGIPGF